MATWTLIWAKMSFWQGALRLYERAQYFLQNDPDLQGIANDFTPEMFTTTGIEVLGTPIGTDAYIKDFVAKNSIKIMKDVEKLDLSAQQIHIDKAIAKAILQKGTRGSYHHWDQDDYDLTVTRLQMPDDLGVFGWTPNVLEQISAKVVMTSRFLQLVGSLPPEEQKLWLPNQTAHDPDSWHAPHLLNLKTGYDILVNNHDCKVQEMYTVQDHPTGYATVSKRTF